VRTRASFLSSLCVQEEIEIDARVLGIGETTGCVTVEVRKKATGKVIAHGRHTKYLAAVSSKL
jgi:acyl-coenzyme A thioesterase 13